MAEALGQADDRVAGSFARKNAFGGETPSAGTPRYPFTATAEISGTSFADAQIGAQF